MTDEEIVSRALQRNPDADYDDVLAWESATSEERVWATELAKTRCAVPGYVWHLPVADFGYMIRLRRGDTG